MQKTMITAATKAILGAALALFTLASCENPFQIGLGEDVDIDRPVISLESPDLGSFLRGTVTFTGVASDDVGVTNVSISFDRGATWTTVDSYSASEGLWSYALNTSARTNGRLGVLVRVTDDSGKQATTEELLFTIDNEAPNIFFIFPAVNPDNYDENNPPTVGKNGAIFGTVTDRDAIGLDSPSIKFWRVGDAEPLTWTNLRSGETDFPAVYDFKYNVPTEEVGEFYMKVEARDIGGQTSVTPTYKVVIVSGAPQIDITAPNQADNVRATTQITGTMSHETGQQPIITLEFYDRSTPPTLLDTVAVADGIVVTPNGAAFDWSYDIDTTAIADGTIIVQALAEIGATVGFDSVVFNVDNESPTVTVTSPGFKETVYSTITLRGIASDNATLEPVSIKIGADPYDTPGDSYNWSYVFDTNLYGNTTHAEEWDALGDVAATGTGIWRLPILIRALDSAGNETIEEHVLFIDQDLDKPTVNILSPLSGSNLAGPVLVTGTAFDADPGVTRVEMQIIAVSDADDVIGYLAPDGSALTSVDWHVVDGTSQWSREINSNGLLYSVTDAGQAYALSTFTHNGRLRVLVRAVDAGGKEGNVQTLPIRLDETIPTIANVSPASNSYVTGSFPLTADISDDEEITSVAVSYDGGTTYAPVYSGTGLGLKTYSLNELIDTTPTGLNVLSESRNLRIRVRDNANYTTITTVTLNIDNYWPDGALNPVPNDPANMSGAVFELRGEAWDRDTGVADNQYPVRGIDSVEVYFEDRRAGSPSFGEYYSISGAATNAGTTADLGNGQGFQDIVSSADHKIVITRDDVGSEDGKAIEPELSDSIWYTRIDSTNLPDGEMLVHYLVTDRAGNQTHRSEPGFVKNHPPAITGLTVGTDLDYSTVVEVDEQFAYASTFDARELVYVSIAASDVTGGNPGIASYDVTRQSTGTSVLAAATGTIDISGYAEWANPGDEETFIVTVTDNDGIETTTNFVLRVDNVDSVAPSGAIDEFTTSNVVDGHVESIAEARDFSGTFDGTSVADTTADVSGTVTISGQASDDQRIQFVYLTVEGYDADDAGVTYTAGGEFLLASWDATDNRLEYNTILGYAANTPVPATLDPATGHDITFAYAWDSAEIATTAAEGVTIDLRIVDFGPNQASDTVDVDVVPYISEIVRTDAVDTSRTKYGRYTLSDGLANLEIHGYNLNPTWVRIYNTAGTASTDLTATLAGVGTPYTSFTADLATNYSGYLWVAVNPGTPVIATNNFNDNSNDQNKEDDGNGLASTLWSDDRYIQLWDVDNDFAGSTDAERPAMSVRSDGVQYAAWSQYTGSDSYYGTDTATQLYYGTYDPPEWNDIAFNDQTDDMFIVHLRNFFDGGANWGYLVINSFEPGPTGQETDARIVDDLDNVLYQYRNPRIAVAPSAANPTRDTIIHMSYYDADTQLLKYSSFLYNRDTDTLTTRTTGTNIVVDNNGNVGIFSDIALDADGVPFIVYYDTTNQRLKTARASDDDPDATGEWNLSTVDTTTSFYGEYVSVTVDGTGAVHVSSYRNSTGDLLYFNASHVASPAPFSFTRTTVDSPDAVGQWSEITMVGTTPYISYINASQSGTFYGLKYAYWTATEWETGTIPVQVPVESERTGIVAKPSGAVLGATDDYVVSVGYGAGSYYFARLRPEQ